MAEKVGGRWQEEFNTGNRFEGISVAVTRKGLEVFGFYDSFVGIEPMTISWEDLEESRKRVFEGVAKT